MSFNILSAVRERGRPALRRHMTGGASETTTLTAPADSPSPLCMAIIIVAAIVIIFWLVSAGVGAVRREKFTSPQAHEVCAQAKELFTKDGNPPTYSEYKSVVATADPVQYDEVKKLWASGNLTPSKVQQVL